LSVLFTTLLYEILHNILKVYGIFIYINNSFGKVCYKRQHIVDSEMFYEVKFSISQSTSIVSDVEEDTQAQVHVIEAIFTFRVLILTLTT